MCFKKSLLLSETCHILFQQMAKVLTAIVHFSPSQVKQILAKEEEREKQSSVSCFDFLRTIFFVKSQQC